MKSDTSADIRLICQRTISNQAWHAPEPPDYPTFTLCDSGESILFALLWMSTSVLPTCTVLRILFTIFTKGQAYTNVNGVKIVYCTVL